MAKITRIIKIMSRVSDATTNDWEMEKARLRTAGADPLQVAETEEINKKVEGYNQDVIDINMEINSFNQLTTKIDFLKTSVDGLLYSDSALSNKETSFDKRSVSVPKDFLDNVADVSVKSKVAAGYSATVEVKQLAKASVKASNASWTDSQEIGNFKKGISPNPNPFSPPSTPSSDKISFDFNEGLKSKNFGYSDSHVSGAFQEGEFRIGENLKIKVENGDTFQGLVKKINDASEKLFADNEKVKASIEQDGTDYYIWIRSASNSNAPLKVSGGALNGNFADSKIKQVDVDSYASDKVNDVLAKVQKVMKENSFTMRYSQGNIVISSDITGKDTAYKSPGFDSLFDIKEEQQGQDAEVVVNGITYTSNSNTVSTEDFVFELKQTTSGQEINLTVQNDTEEITKQIQELIKNYNEDFSIFIAKQLMRVQDPDRHSKPAKDAYLAEHQDMLHSLNEKVIDQIFRPLLNYGIDIKDIDYTQEADKESKEVYLPQKLTRIALDEKKFEKALQNNFDTVKKIIAGKPFVSNNTEFSLDQFNTATFNLSKVDSLNYEIKNSVPSVEAIFQDGSKQTYNAKFDGNKIIVDDSSSPFNNFSVVFFGDKTSNHTAKITYDPGAAKNSYNTLTSYSNDPASGDAMKPRGQIQNMLTGSIASKKNEAELTYKDKLEWAKNQKASINRIWAKVRMAEQQSNYINDLYKAMDEQNKG